MGGGEEKEKELTCVQCPGPLQPQALCTPVLSAASQPPSPQPSGEEPELQGGRAVCPPAQLSVVEQREVSNLVLSLCIHPTTLSYSIRKT